MKYFYIEKISDCFMVRRTGYPFKNYGMFAFECDAQKRVDTLNEMFDF